MTMTDEELIAAVENEMTGYGSDAVAELVRRYRRLWLVALGVRRMTDDELIDRILTECRAGAWSRLQFADVEELVRRYRMLKADHERALRCPCGAELDLDGLCTALVAKRS